MMLGLEDLSDSSEDDETSCLQQPTLPNLSKQILPQPSNQPLSLESQSCRKSTRIKRAKTNPIPDSPSNSSCASSSKRSTRRKISHYKKKTSKVFNEINEQSPCLSFQCKIRGCSVKKPSEQDLFEHVRIDHPDRKYRCNICPNAFFTVLQCSRHRWAHSEEKCFKCHQCGKTFKYLNTLKYHEATHSIQPLISCRVGKCKLKLPRENLENHIKAAHPEYKHKCSSCHMRFRFNYALVVHKRVHSGVKSYECEECGKTFFDKHHLQTHQRVHTGERPFECKECGKTFTTKGNLKTHLRTHTGEKPFSCTLCGEQFSQLSSCKIHEISCSEKL